MGVTNDDAITKCLPSGCFLDYQPRTAPQLSGSAVKKGRVWSQHRWHWGTSVCCTQVLCLASHATSYGQTGELKIPHTQDFDDCSSVM